MDQANDLTLVSLPAELTLLILSYLPLSTLGSLQRVNRYLLTFVTENQSTVYRNAAWIEGWIPNQGTQLKDLRISEGLVDKEEIEKWSSDDLYSQRAMRGVQGWRDFCHRRNLVSLAWSAKAPSTILSSPRMTPSYLKNIVNRNPYHRVHRIKVDEKAGIIMTTTALGGLVVRDLETDVILWELPTSYVPSYAHLEYDKGYMLFNRADGSTEAWLRTDIATSTSLVTSHPDGRQLEMAAHLSRSAKGTCTRAQFTPHALFVTSEPTRASRFVFPILLVSGLERAFLWDISTGECVQTLEEIQVVSPLLDSEDTEEELRADEHEEVDALLTDEDIIDATSVSDGNDPTPVVSPLGSPVDDTVQDPDDAEADDDDEDMLPRFLGIIRYVEISERHVVLVGRYLLRVFSRQTGKSILDIPSTRPRYGAARWEVASAAWARNVDGDQKKTEELKRIDNYEVARMEGRELVRMPLRFTYENLAGSPKLLIDLFIAAHMSKDGRHLVALLSGLRVIIIPFFETLSFVGGSSTMSSTEVSTSTISPITEVLNSPQYVPNKLQSLRVTRRRLKREREQELFSRTLEVQLGAPRAANSVYLAYEHGRIGVVTTNAVYLITPNIAHEPTPDLIPNLTVSRAPFFSNQSWLTAVSCLMMSDTGMYLNWNPSLPAWNADGEDRKLWEREFQWEIGVYENAEADQYHTLPSGDMFVGRDPDRGETVEQSHLSTVFTINFAPSNFEATVSPV